MIASHRNHFKTISGFRISNTFESINLNAKDDIRYRSPSYKLRCTGDVLRIEYNIYNSTVANDQKNSSEISLIVHRVCNNKDDSIYQVTCSISRKPEFGTISFQGYITSSENKLNSSFFTMNDLIKAGVGSDYVEIYVDLLIPNELNNYKFKDIEIFESCDFLPMYENGDFSDVTLKTKDKDFKAHRIILASRSNFFARMFHTEMKESKTSVVSLLENELRTEVIEGMLYYMYTNSIKNLDTMACELYAAAHLYDVRDLQDKCEDYIASNIKVENLTVILKLCDKYPLQDIEEKALAFFKSNECSVVEREEFIVYLIESMKIDKVATSLILSKKYELLEFRDFLMKFITMNYKEVMKDPMYRMLYRDKSTIDLVIEVDDYISNHYIELIQN